MARTRERLRPSTLVDAQASELSTRLKVVIRSFGSDISAARAIGRKKQTINNWKNGISDPPLPDAIAVCQASGHFVEWLATGREPAPPPAAIDEARLARAIARLRALIGDRGELAPLHEAWLLAALYEDPDEPIGGARLREIFAIPVE